jgi:hypothetical protein
VLFGHNSDGVTVPKTAEAASPIHSQAAPYTQDLVGPTMINVDKAVLKGAKFREVESKMKETTFITLRNEVLDREAYITLNRP